METSSVKLEGRKPALGPGQKKPEGGEGVWKEKKKKNGKNEQCTKINCM